MPETVGSNSIGAEDVKGRGDRSKASPVYVKSNKKKKKGKGGAGGGKKMAHKNRKPPKETEKVHST